MNKKELLCPYCGANLLAKCNTIHRKLTEVENFSIENYKIYFSHAYGETCSGMICNNCENDISELLEDYEIEF